MSKHNHSHAGEKQVPQHTDELTPQEQAGLVTEAARLTRRVMELFYMWNSTLGMQEVVTREIGVLQLSTATTTNPRAKILEAIASRVVPPNWEWETVSAPGRDPYLLIKKYNRPVLQPSPCSC